MNTNDEQWISMMPETKMWYFLCNINIYEIAIYEQFMPK